MLDQALVEVLTGAVEANNCCLWGYELVGAKENPILRVYIEKKGGVLLDDCVQVSRQIKHVFAVEEKRLSHYQLEVSSPGVDKVLFTPEHYRSYVGETIIVRIRGKKNRSKGKLLSVMDGYICLACEHEELTIPFEDIVKGRLASR